MSIHILHPIFESIYCAWPTVAKCAYEGVSFFRPNGRLKRLRNILINCRIFDCAVLCVFVAKI